MQIVVEVANEPPVGEEDRRPNRNEANQQRGGKWKLEDGRTGGLPSLDRQAYAGGGPGRQTIETAPRRAEDCLPPRHKARAASDELSGLQQTPSRVSNEADRCDHEQDIAERLKPDELGRRAGGWQRRTRRVDQTASSATRVPRPG